MSADLKFMTSADPVAPPSSVVSKLAKHHDDLLDPGESFIAAVRCGAADRLAPGAVFGKLGPVGRRMQRSLAADDLEERARQVRVYLHRRGLDQVEFPPSRVGYVIALTQFRVILFDASGRKFLSDSPVRMFLDEIDVEGDTIFLFIEGKEAAAVAIWEDDETATDFVERYRETQRAGAQRQAS